jgi:AcrR family transcriptional regulator
VVRDDGLRARKRRETRGRLEEAALFFVGRDGLDQATIEQICERADVSPRTFFNYFDSKEDALLGMQALELDAHTLTELVKRYGDAEPLEAVLGLIFILCGPSIEHMVDQRQRVEVILRYPQLATRTVTRIARLSEAITGVVRDILASRPGWQGVDLAAGSAEVVLGLCMGAVRKTVESSLPLSLSHPDRADLAHLEARSLALARETVRRLAAPSAAPGSLDA